MYRVAYTGGTFDMLHVGHIELLQYCREVADKVVVSLNTDEFIKRYKGKSPVIPYVQRMEMLLSTKYVDEVVPNFGGEDSKPAILEVNPDVIVIGMDWLDKDYCKQMSFTPKWLSENNISLLYVPRTTGISTTKLKKDVYDYVSGSIL